MNGICYLVCAGESTPLDFVPSSTDLVIAVDGGYSYLKSAGVEPNVCVGDFDSLGAIPVDGNVLQLDPIKDVTDTFAAVEEGLRRGYTEFRIYCALGGRLSHSIANIQTLSFLMRKGACGKIIGEGTEITVFDKTANFEPGGYLSLFPLTSTAVVKIENCKYSGTFEFTRSDSLGVSNEPFCGARVTVLSGEVFSVAERK